MWTALRRLTLLLALTAPAVASAQDATTYPFDGSFEDATFAVENTIIGQGLVIDYVSHVGEMLARTGADVGSDVKIFDAADVFLFCSALLSRKVMEADPMNVAHCPYGIFVTDREGAVQIGYRHLPDGPMDEVEALLDMIAREAAGG
jgi:uncharacterized protein (DUF302 family)